MPNKAYLGDDGIIYEIYDGDQDGASIRSMIDQTWVLVDESVEKKRPVLVFADVRAIEHVSLDARQYAGKALTKWPYDKIALYGPNVYLRHVANLILIATNHTHNVKSFADANDAIAWLKEPLNGK